jgi:putative PIN family toxin of toxin-antitoxin system
MKVVLDTNILVSAILSPGGKCERVVTLALGGRLRTCADARVFTEYAEVLGRDELAFRSEEAHALLSGLEATSERVGAPPLPLRLPHASDLPFLEVAHAAGACLVTGNLRHYPKRARAGVVVLTPGELLDLLRERA